jgi:methyl-accepting chemotaxis protein
VRPSTLPAATKGSEWIGAIYLQRALATYKEDPDDDANTVVLLSSTSPRVLFEQLFAQGIPGVAKIFQFLTIGLAGAVLFVYLIALALAFALVARITRNVNRMSRAAEGIARGDFSVRVNTKSRDQIGDLARSFDGMAESIQRLLVDTARKERLEGEIAIARTIQRTSSRSRRSAATITTTFLSPTGVRRSRSVTSRVTDCRQGSSSRWRSRPS